MKSICGCSEKTPENEKSPETERFFPFAIHNIVCKYEKETYYSSK
jgi:hypothetical protein